MLKKPNRRRGKKILKKGKNQRERKERKSIRQNMTKNQNLQ